MTRELPALGKLDPASFRELILPRLGRARREVLIGPRAGVDVGVVELPGGQVMVTTTDPVFVVPRYGWERSAWFAVHILASDVATSGLPPSYLTIDLNLPLSMTRAELDALWSTIHAECDRLGMAIVSGHTGRYQGCDYPMIGGATVIAVGPKDRYVAACQARPGDQVLVTKGPGIEAAGLFAVSFPERIAARRGAAFAAEAERLFYQMSVVEDALVAVQAGVGDDGVTAMHDATECGVLGALVEVAEASGVGLRVEESELVVPDVVAGVLELFDVDPCAAISEGTLVLTCRPPKTREIIERLGEHGIPARAVGEVLERDAGLTLRDRRGARRELRHPVVDPFWAAFARASSEENTRG